MTYDVEAEAREVVGRHATGANPAQVAYRAWVSSPNTVRDEIAEALRAAYAAGRAAGLEEATRVDALERRLQALEAAPVLVVDPACKRCEGGRITWEEIHGDGLAIGNLCPCVNRREEPTA